MRTSPTANDPDRSARSAGTPANWGRRRKLGLASGSRQLAESVGRERVAGVGGGGEPAGPPREKSKEKKNPRLPHPALAGRLVGDAPLTWPDSSSSRICSGIAVPQFTNHNGASCRWPGRVWWIVRAERAPCRCRSLARRSRTVENPRWPPNHRDGGRRAFLDPHATPGADQPVPASCRRARPACPASTPRRRAASRGHGASGAGERSVGEMTCRRPTTAPHRDGLPSRSLASRPSRNHALSAPAEASSRTKGRGRRADRPVEQDNLVRALAPALRGPRAESYVKPDPAPFARGPRCNRRRKIAEPAS